MACLKFRAVAGLNDGERRQRAEVAVKVPTARHGIDVRPELDRRQRRLTARSSTEDIARRIDTRLEARAAHEVQHVRPAGDVGVRIGDTADAVRKRSAGRPAEHAQRLDPLTESRRVRTHVLRGRGRPSHRDAAQGSNRRDGEAAQKIPTCEGHEGMVHLRSRV